MKPLKSEPQTIFELFTGYEFIIPNFQRRYSWNKDDCKKLWDDILYYVESDADPEQEKYYLGCIVVYPDKNNRKIWNIIDGQQRITTLLMFIKVLFSHASTYDELAKMMYQKDEYTGKIKKDALRLVSEVIGDSGTNDRDDFNMIMNYSIVVLKQNKLLNKSLFLSNSVYIEEELVDEWVNKFRADTEGLKKNIKKIVDGLVMLPLECTSREDALNLFEGINNRGNNLTDDDIFKAKIYQKYSDDSSREKFVKRWGSLGNERGDLFLGYMHIQRAADAESSTRVKLRNYIGDKLREVSSEEGLNNILIKIEKIYRAIRIVEHRESICIDESLQSKEFIYWHILSKYSNIYYRYPLFAFIDKYGEFSDGEFKLECDRQEEYINLLENTIRYFYIKGVVYNFLDAVRETSYQACCAIYKGEDYVAQYEEDVNKKNDLGVFFEKIKNSDYGQRYRQGLIVLNSLFNKDQCEHYDDYAEILEKKYHIEHILPQNYCNYDRWDEEPHKNNIERIGNLMPLERRINITAGNEFFKKKQVRYKKSKVQDALTLSRKDPTWYPKDVEKRHKESVKRLQTFFEKFTRI